MEIYRHWALTSVILVTRMQFLVPESSLVLTSDPSSSSGPFCGGPVVFTCTATDISIILEWQLNGSVISDYRFVPGQDFPQNVSLRSQAPAVTVQVTNATGIAGTSSANIISTLSVSNVSILNGFSLHCQDGLFVPSNTKDIVVTRLSSPPAPAPNCTILASPGHQAVTLRWSDVYNSLHVVEHLIVTVTPDPSSCSIREACPNEDYSCSGLDPGTNYSMTFSAINCRDQEGENGMYSLRLQGPESPAVMNVNTNSSSIIVQWKEVVVPSFSSRCSFDATIFYFVTIEDSSGEVVAEMNVPSDSCIDSLCSTTTVITEQYCRVGVRASNVIGNSTTQYSSRAARLTSSNRVQLGLGLVFFLLAVFLLVINIILVAKEKQGGFKNRLWKLSYRSKTVVFLCGVLLATMTLMLWVAVGLQVELQDNTCNPAWQSARNSLIISALTFSLVSLVVSVVVLMVRCVPDSSPKAKKTSSGTSGNFQLTNEENPSAEGGKFEQEEKVSKPKVKTGTAGNNETYVADDFRKTGEENLDAKLRVLEEKHLAEQPPKVDVSGNSQSLPPDVPIPDNGAKKEEVYDALVHGRREGGNPPPLQPPPLQDPAYYSQLSVNAAGSNEQVVYDRLDLGKGKLRDITKCNPISNEYGEYGTLQQPPCVTLWKLNTWKLTPDEGDHVALQQSLIADWFPDERKWSKEDLSDGKPLRVHFLNSCPKKWKYTGEKITPELIMQFLSETWKGCFTIGDQDDSHIRIIYEVANHYNWSIIGSMAKMIEKTQPTMLFNFSRMNDEEIKGTIVHQFGHALGLGHTLMKPAVWEVIKEYLDLQQLLSFYGSPSLDEFKVQWTGKGRDPESVNYDEKSIMAYSISTFWVKDGTLRTSEDVQSASEVSDEVKKCLLKLIKHTRLRSELSADDAKVLRTIFGVMFGWDELLSLRNERTKKTFNLATKIAASWQEVGRSLGIEEEDMKSVETFKDVERIEWVLSRWFNHLDNLTNKDLYPLSWEGLRKLLVDSGLRKTAEQYFTFLNGLNPQ